MRWMVLGALMLGGCKSAQGQDQVTSGGNDLEWTEVEVECSGLVNSETEIEVGEGATVLTAQVFQCRDTVCSPDSLWLVDVQTGTVTVAPCSGSGTHKRIVVMR